MRNGKIVRLRRVGAWLAGAAVLGACDAPTDPGGSAVAGGPSLLVAPACAGTSGRTYATQSIRTATTWTRAGGPHRVTGEISVDAGGRLTIAPGAVVCFEPGTGLLAQNGGRLNARGRDTAQVVLTARDAALGWNGIRVSGTPTTPSYLTNVRIEHVGLGGIGVHATEQHPVYLDSAVIRQAGQALRLHAPASRIARSRVDTTTNRTLPAVDLGAGTRFEQTVVRGSASTGVRVSGADVLLLGGRIEGSRGTGLDASADSLNRYSKAVRVVGAGAYGARLSVAALRRLYSTPALQDSLLGNVRDTVVLSGGTLQGGQVIVGGRLPFRVTGTLELRTAGTLSAHPGAVLVFAPLARVIAWNGGRVVARGSAAQPVLFTADDAARGWGGLTFNGGATTGTAYLTNVRIEHVRGLFPAVGTYTGQPVVVDSSIIRQTGFAVVLHSANSRLSRTRVDTTLDGGHPAVELGANARIESTRIRAPAGHGLSLFSTQAQVVSCEIRDGDRDGIVLGYAMLPIRNCNLVDNAGAGISFGGTNTLNASGNWWGSTGGPLGPGGDGVSASAGTIVYSPWRTTPFVLPYLP
jgi:hypothetical protein